jgi:transposase
VAARGVGRAGGDLRAARGDALPGQAVTVACRVEGPGASDVGQGRGDPRARLDLGDEWQQWLDELRLGDEYINRIASLRDLIEIYDRQIHDCDVRIYRRLKGHPGYEAIQALRGVGPVLAAVFIAEIGDVTCFANARRLCSWAGLTPRHRESDSHVARGRISKQGSRLLRWACVEAVSGAVRDTKIASIKTTKPVWPT